jgi:Tfp pilus assembly protein PilF
MIRTVAIALVLAAALVSCATAPPPPAPSSVASLYQRPGERALILGLAQYEQAAFDRAEQSFRTALKAGLTERQDVATAHKYLAFISCAFNRIDECERNFRAAFAADDKFALTSAEAGHPMWGPVFRRVEAERGKK